MAQHQLRDAAPSFPRPYLSTYHSSLQLPHDSISDLAPKKHKPKTASLRSALIPGWGQAYNKKYWKIPIIYAGIGGLVYALDQNQKEYNTLRQAYIFTTDDDTATIGLYQGRALSADVLASLRDTYRRYRDLSVVGLFAVYVLNIIDANVDAHLFEFNVDDNLTLNFVPCRQVVSSRSYHGIGINLKLK